MIRYLRVSGVSNAEARVVYYANKPRFITDNKIFNQSFASAYMPPASKTPVVFDDSIVVSVPSSNTAAGRYYEATIEVSDNQPALESVNEVTTFGLSISVYNEYGVKICDNGVKVSSTQSSGTTNAPGEMTSVPGTEPGEMTSVPGEEPGEMTVETTDEPGAMN